MVAKKNSNRPKRYRTKLDWDAIREDYLVRNLDPEEKKKYSVTSLAKVWHVSRVSIDKHVKKEDWNGELRRRTQAIADARIDVAQDSIIEKQQEIRERHGNVAKGIISKAIMKFNSLNTPEKELTVPDMLKMFAFALPAEREAAGMAKYIEISDVTPTDPAREFETPIMRMERRRVQREVEAELIEVHKRMHGAPE